MTARTMWGTGVYLKTTSGLKLEWRTEAPESAVGYLTGPVVNEQAKTQDGSVRAEANADASNRGSGEIRTVAMPHVVPGLDQAGDLLKWVGKEGAPAFLASFRKETGRHPDNGPQKKIKVSYNNLN